MKKPSLAIIFLTVFIDLIGFGIVLPLLPAYSKRFGADGFWIGCIIASFSIMQFLFAPAWGRLSDRIGRRPVLLISNAGSAISYAIFALAARYTGDTGLILLIISRVFAGICGANLSVASAYIADITPVETRSKSMGLIGMAFGLGFIFGPVLGALSAGWFGLQGPGWIAAGLCAFNFLLGCSILVESRRPDSSSASARPRFNQWLQTLSQPKVGFLIGVYFLATFCFTCFESTFSLFLLESPHFHYTEKNVGYLFAYCGIVSAMVQGGGVGKLIKRFGEPKLIAGTLIFVSISLVMLPLSTGLTSLLLGLALFAASSGLNRPPTFGMISIHSSQSAQGEALGVAQSAGSLARIIGPLFATSFYKIRPAAPYLTCAVVAFIAGCIAWRYLCTAPKSPR
jgi:MFS transporter, DHA1 family, tetracycline resistance protein